MIEYDSDRILKKKIGVFVQSIKFLIISLIHYYLFFAVVIFQILLLFIQLIDLSLSESRNFLSGHLLKD